MSNKGLYTVDYRKQSARDEEVTEAYLDHVRATLSEIPGVTVHPWSPPMLFEFKAPLTFSTTCDRARVTKVAMTGFTGVDILEVDGDWGVYVAKRRAIEFSYRAWTVSVLVLVALIALAKAFQPAIEKHLEL